LDSFVFVVVVAVAVAVADDDVGETANPGCATVYSYGYCHSYYSA